MQESDLHFEVGKLRMRLAAEFWTRLCHNELTVEYDTIYLRALKNWREGQLNSAQDQKQKIRKN